jgi:hypothetical protein
VSKGGEPVTFCVPCSVVTPSSPTFVTASTGIIDTRPEKTPVGSRWGGLNPSFTDEQR